MLADEQLAPVTGGGYDLTSPGNVVWTLADNEGTIRDLAVYNAQTGLTTVVNHRIYDPFGKLVSQTNPATGNAAAVDCLFGSTGCATDANTDIEFHERRVKTSGSTDWLSQDPINVTSGVTNLDDYCGNDPINATDPSGLRETDDRWTTRTKNLVDVSNILEGHINAEIATDWSAMSTIAKRPGANAATCAANLVKDIYNVFGKDAPGSEISVWGMKFAPIAKIGLLLDNVWLSSASNQIVKLTFAQSRYHAIPLRFLRFGRC